MKNILIVLSFLLILSSCKEKEEKPEPPTIIGTWIMVDTYGLKNGVKEFSSWPDTEECTKDDEYTYHADGTMSWSSGALKCSWPNDKDYDCCSHYEWDKANNKIIRKTGQWDSVKDTITYLPNGLEAEIIELTQSTMSLKLGNTPFTNPVQVYKRIR